MEPTFSDSSEDSKESLRNSDEQSLDPNNLVPDVGRCRDQPEANSGTVVSPVGKKDSTLDSERTQTSSFEHVPSNGHGDYEPDAESGYRKAGHQYVRSQAEILEKQAPMKTDQQKTVAPFYQVVTTQGGSGVSNIQRPMNNNLVRDTGDGKILLANTPKKRGFSKLLPNNKMEVTETCGDGQIPPQVEHRKEYLPLPQWLKDCNSGVADLDGWQHVQVTRTDASGRKDKYYIHSDYAHTFRSKPEVTHFLNTGEVKGKGLLKKISADPSGQSSGSRRSTKKRVLRKATNPIHVPQGYNSFTRDKLPHGFV